MKTNFHNNSTKIYIQ